MPNVINPPGWERATRESNFVPRLPSVVKYIDDSLIIEKINMKTPPLLEDLDGRRFKSVNPSRSQDLFTHIVASAEEKGMVVNAAKTGLLCVSGATSFEARAHLDGGNEDQVDSSEKLKVLGFFFDKDAGV